MELWKTGKLAHLRRLHKGEISFPSTYFYFMIKIKDQGSLQNILGSLLWQELPERALEAAQELLQDDQEGTGQREGRETLRDLKAFFKIWSVFSKTNTKVNKISLFIWSGMRLFKKWILLALSDVVFS